MFRVGEQRHDAVPFSLSECSSVQNPVLSVGFNEVDASVFPRHCCLWGTEWKYHLADNAKYYIFILERTFSYFPHKHDKMASAEEPQQSTTASAPSNLEVSLIWFLSALQ